MKDSDRVQYMSDNLPSANVNEGYERAVKHKDKLLDYDKTRSDLYYC